MMSYGSLMWIAVRGHMSNKVKSNFETGEYESNKVWCWLNCDPCKRNNKKILIKCFAKFSQDKNNFKIVIYLYIKTHSLNICIFDIPSEWLTKVEFPFFVYDYLQGKMESLYSLLYPSRREVKRGTVQYINTSAPVPLR